MEGGGQYNVVLWFSAYVFFSGILTHASLLPGPVVYVTNNSNVTFTCLATNNWNVIFFYDNGIQESVLASVIFQGNGTHCRALYTDTRFGADKYSALPCYVGQPISITVRYINASYHNKTISCRVDSGQLSNTTVKIREILTSLKMDPNGKRTITEGASVSFTCTAKSLPKSSIEWHISGSTLTSAVTITSPQENTVISSLTYLAKKEHHNENIFCSANDLFTEMNSSTANLNILYRPIVTISPNNNPFHVLENTTNMQMTCNVTDANPAVTSFTWKKDDFTISRTANYTIPIVNRSHAGSYTCSATNSVGNSDPSTAIQLEVLYGVEIVTVSKKEPLDGIRLTVTCSGQSNPAMTDNDVTWTKQNNNTFIMMGKHLVINNVNKVDSGNYVCSVVIKLIPSVGPLVTVSGITTVEVDVLYRPTVTISPKYVQYEVIENTTNIVLDCTVTDANPAATSYRWYKNGSIINGSIGAAYTIPTVRRSHTGNYTCDATNSVGNSDLSSDLQLNVLYGVDINPLSKKEPTESTTLSVFCDIKSYPEVRNYDVTWTKQNNLTFISRGQQLVIDSVHRTDSGTYVCSVTITLSPTVGQSVNVTGTTSIEVNVLYRPTVTVSPDYKLYNVIENTTNLQLTCAVTDANPAVMSYIWYKESSFISNNVIYIISIVSRSHAGNYTCTAVNSVGSSIPSSALQLNVQYGVNINPIGKTKPPEGTQLTITCSGQSYPVMTSSDVKWFKQNNNTFAKIGLQLVIDNVNRLDSGIYVCSVSLQLTPTIGQTVNVTGSTTVEVDVLYRPDVTVSPDINQYHVTENTTNVYLTCIIKDANPSVTSYTWYKNGVTVSTAAIYIISTVYRSHTGNYTCDATNVVGISDLTPELHLDVLYGVSLKLSGTEVNINESERWDLTCIGDGNPLPNINWIYNYNGTIVGAQKANVTYINVEHANCVDTGLYMCSGNNSISEPVSQSADIKVACKPRTYNNLDRVDVLMRATDESINISTTFISFPLAHISWSRMLSGGHLADLDSNFKYFTIQSHLPYETIAILQKDQLKPNEFGIYLVNASNIYGSFLMKYHFIQKRDPIPPSYVYVVCKSTTAIVILKPIVNENLPQDLYIQYAVEGKDMTSIKVHTNGANQPIEYTVTGLNPGRSYNFSILGVNPFGETRSNQVECLTETLSFGEDMLALKKDNSGMFSAGIASLVIGLLFFVAATIFIFRKRFKKTYTKSSKSDEYSDLQTSNPAFQDPYTSLQNPIESRHHQESSANTYEECENASDAAAYQNIENMKSGHKKAEKNMGIYDNMKI